MSNVLTLLNQLIKQQNIECTSLIFSTVLFPWEKQHFMNKGINNRKLTMVSHRGHNCIDFFWSPPKTAI